MKYLVLLLDLHVEDFLQLLTMKFSTFSLLSF